ncbi:MAG: UDP-N-acetylmuramoyl-L-alanyl-D-glutamate--2,6-diaminopimelate ligase [Phycisphaeraceae bacterium]
MMRLDALIAGLDLRVEQGSAALELTDLVEDSRQVQPGCAFLARAGDAADGRAFIADAIQRGAAAIITDTEPPADVPESVTWVRAVRADVRLAATLAERFFDHPSHALRLIGVTGTNGKTTTATLIHHLLNAAGVTCGLIGTLGVTVPSSRFQVSSSDDGGDAADQLETRNLKLETGLTTPGPIDFSRILAVMRNRGCRAAVTEVSSHALEQGRVAALQFDVAVFTNLTGDHLDYHGTMDAYAAAKARLFAQLDQTPGKGWAVVNVDDPYAPRMLEAFPGPAAHVLRCSVRGDAGSSAPNDAEAPECCASILKLAANASRARFDGPWGSVEAELPLVGRHNIANALQAAAAAHAIIDLTRTLRRALVQCPPVPGRLERVPSSTFPLPDAPEEGNAKLPAVLVDYAHTHDALENVLLALRPLTEGRLLVVFGCGGDRDREKRPKMAQVACRFGDAIWITSDNPRTEDPQRIIDDMLKGVSGSRFQVSSSDDGGEAADPQLETRNLKLETLHVQPDRAKAIREAILAAGSDDTVLIAGKGHEDYQILADRTIHFDDREQAVAALRQWKEERSASCRPSR